MVGSKLLCSQQGESCRLFPPSQPAAGSWSQVSRMPPLGEPVHHPTLPPSTPMHLGLVARSAAPVACVPCGQLSPNADGGAHAQAPRRAQQQVQLAATGHKSSQVVRSVPTLGRWLCTCRLDCSTRASAAHLHSGPAARCSVLICCFDELHPALPALTCTAPSPPWHSCPAPGSAAPAGSRSSSSREA